MLPVNSAGTPHAPDNPPGARLLFEIQFFRTAKTWLECRHALITLRTTDPLFTLVGELDAAHELQLLAKEQYAIKS